jgi:hypothetical protein
VCVNDIAPSQAKMDRLVAELNEIYGAGTAIGDEFSHCLSLFL